MYPRQELIRLATHKAALRRDIAVSRAECVAAARDVGRPVEWLDRAVAMVRELPPLARVGMASLGLLVRRTVVERITRLAGVLRWAPMLSSLLGKKR